MKSWFMSFFVVSVVMILAGCSTTAELFPVRGPLSTQIPVPVLHARVDGIMGNSGRIRLTLPDGEQCAGRWASVAPTFSGTSAVHATGSTVTSNGSIWTTVYGHSFVFGNVPGANKGQAVLTGTKGAIIEAEFLTGSGTANGYGVATDNRGNVFKVLF